MSKIENRKCDHCGALEKVDRSGFVFAQHRGVVFTSETFAALDGGRVDSSTWGERVDLGIHRLDFCRDCYPSVLAFFNGFISEDAR